MLTAGVSSCYPCQAATFSIVTGEGLDLNFRSKRRTFGTPDFEEFRNLDCQTSIADGKI